MADQMYYPIEHIAWARDLKICKGDSSQLWDVGCGLWVMSLTFGIMKTLRKLCLLEKQEQACKNAYDKPQPSDQNGTQRYLVFTCKEILLSVYNFLFLVNIDSIYFLVLKSLKKYFCEAQQVYK